MPLLPSKHPVSGMNDASPTSTTAPASCPLAIVPGGETGAPGNGEGPDAEDAPDDFARLVRIMQSNERLFGALQVLSGRLQGVRSYLAAAGCNVRLGRAYHCYWRARHSGVLTLLRANRLEARRLLARIDPESSSYRRRLSR